MKKRYSILTAILFLFGAAATIAAQVSTSGSLRGRIADAQEAGVPNATLTLTSVERETSQTTTTNGDGEYNFGRVAPGNYRLTIEASSFQKLVKENVVVTVNENVTLDAALSVGSVSETVNVESNQEIAQTESSEISALVNERRVKDLPLNGKDFQKLVLLAPGVGGGSFSNPSFSGSRTTTNTYTIDGGNVNDERTTNGIAPSGIGESNTSVPNIVSTEAVREFRVITSNADATFGRGSGAQINLITKSGTNDFHGSLYEYLRNDAFDARSFFNNGPFFNANGAAKVPPFRQNLYGASFGGPIYFLGFGEGTPTVYDGHDKQFFFVNYEGFRQKLQQTQTVNLPNAALLNLIPGDLGRLYRTFFIDRGVVPSNGNPTGAFSPLSATERNAAIAAGFAPALFDGNSANGEAGTALQSIAPTRDITQDAVLVRTDHRLTKNLTANFHYLYAKPLLTSSGVTPIDRNLDFRREQNFAAQFDYALSSNQNLEFRATLNRSEYNTGTEGALDPRLLALGIPSGAGFSITTGTGLPNIALYPTKSFLDNQTVPNVSVAHTWTRNNLTVRSGADLRFLRIEVDNIAGAQTVYTFTNFVGQTGILGSSPTQAQALTSSARFAAFGVDGSPNQSLRNFRSDQQEYYVQGDWRIRRNLTLNLGVRYSYFSPYRERDGLLANLYAVNSSGQIVPDVSPFAFGRAANTFAAVSGGRPFYQPDKNNFQPRLGFAWDVFGKGQTVVRAGYGKYIDRLYQIVFSNSVSNLPQAISSNTSFVPFRLGTSVPVNAQIPSYTGVDPAIKNPETHRFNFAVEQELGKDMSITAAYVGLRGRKLIRALEANGSGAVTQSLRPDTRFSDQRIYTNYSESNYNALQIFFRRRLAKGIDATVAYTYAKSTDDFSIDRTFGNAPTLLNTGASAASGFQGGGSLFVPLPIAADVGRSDFDVRHNLTISHVIDLPFGKGRKFFSNAGGIANGLLGGWTLAGLAIIRSGEPFNIISGIDYNDDGTSGTDRPQLIGGQSLNALFANGAYGRTQYLVPRAQALTILQQIPTSVTDPFLPIKRNQLSSPSVRIYDVSLIKNIRFGERLGLRLEANAFNVFNRANFAAPNANLNSATFGTVTALRSGTTPRQLQFGAKLTF